MASAVKSYITNYLRNNTAVGIVSFSSKGTKLAPMTLITGSEVRDYLNKKVPTTAGGYTAIGAGLQLCQTVSLLTTIIQLRPKT